MGIEDNISKNRGTWELFEAADGHDLSLARAAHIDRQGRLWLRLGDSLICTDGRHVIKCIDLSVAEGGPNTVNNLCGFSSSDVFWTAVDQRLISVSLADGSRQYHGDKVPSLEGVYWMWTSARNDILLGLPGGRLVRYDGETATTYEMPANKDGRLQSATIAPDGTLWVTSIEGLHHVLADGETRFYANEFFGEVDLWDVLVDGGGDVWIPVGGRIHLFHESTTGEVETIVSKLQFNPKPVLHDDEGNLWVLAVQIGAFCVSRSGKITFPYEDTLALNKPKYVVKDHAGSFWFAGMEEGICRYNPCRINSLGRMRVDTATVTPEGRVLVAAGFRGLFEYENRDLVVRSPQMSLVTTAMAMGQDGKLFITSGRMGLSIFDCSSGVTTYAADVPALVPVATKITAEVVVGAGGDAWFRTQRMLCRYNGSELTLIDLRNLGFANAKVAVFADSAGTVWVASDVRENILNFTQDGESRFADRIGVGLGAVNCFFEESAEVMWICTDKGSVIRCGRSRRTFSLVMSLGSLTSINHMRIDERGVYWVSTSRGLFIIDDNNSYVMQESAMLPSGNVIMTHGLPGGRVLIVTKNGVCEYEPYLGGGPEVFIRNAETGSLVERPELLTLHESSTRLAVRMASINMKPAPVKYQYRLLGYNDAWVDTWQEEVLYDHLPIGNYRFEARAVDQDLLTSINIASLPIEIIEDPRDKAISELEVELRDAKGFAENIIRSISEAIIVVNPEGVIVTVNDAALDLLGYFRAELLGKSLDAVFSGEARSAFARGSIAKLATTGRRGGGEYQMVKQDGGLVPVLLSVSAMYVGQGELQGFVLAASDLTQYKQLQSQLLQSQKMESLGVLAGGIAHDFNNMLAVIMGNAELVKGNIDENSPNSQPLSDIIAASEQAAKLCSEMLAYAGKEQIHPAPLSISKMAAQNAQLLHSAISKKIELVCDLPDGLPKVMGDEAQLMQLVMNLITNAAEAIGDNTGTITLTTGSGLYTSGQLESPHNGKTPPAGEYVVLTVGDTGCGMDSKTMRHIFEPFFTTKFLGRGLGLSAVHGIIKSHGAALKVESSVGEGSTFKVYFPALKNVLPEAVEKPEPAAVLPAGGGTALLVDDEPGLLEVLSRIFISMGYEVLKAGDGVAGLKMLKDNVDSIAIVFLDVAMPRMDGTEAYGHMRHIKPDLPIVICSGYSETDISSRFIHDEHLLFLRKPYRLDHVTAKVAQALVQSKEG